jgi:hypothetical protein
MKKNTGDGVVIDENFPITGNIPRIVPMLSMIIPI